MKPDTQLAAELNLSTGKLRSVIRRVCRDEDYTLEGKTVLITESGEAAVRDWLGKEPAQKTALPAPERTKAIAVVTHHFSRPNFLRAQIGDTLLPENSITVNVRDNAKFCLKQEIPVIRNPGESTWRLACPHPSERGRLPGRFDLEAFRKEIVQ